MVRRTDCKCITSSVIDIICSGASRQYEKELVALDECG